MGLETFELTHRLFMSDRAYSWLRSSSDAAATIQVLLAYQTSHSFASRECPMPVILLANELNRLPVDRPPFLF